MRKSLLVLLLAVLCPGLLLAWLALQSAREQEIVLTQRTTELLQRKTEQVATATRAVVAERRLTFAQQVRELLSHEPADQLARHFASKLQEQLSNQTLGFALDAAGRLQSPTTAERLAIPTWAARLRDNYSFIAGGSTEVVFSVPPDELQRPDISLQTRSGFAYQNARNNDVVANSGQNFSAEKRSGQNVTLLSQNTSRNISISQLPNPPESQLTWSTSEFLELTRTSPEGVVTRFIADRLYMIFWVRPAAAPQQVFGALLQAEDFSDAWSTVFLTDSEAAYVESTSAPAYFLALLNDKAQPVATSATGRKPADWKRPFVASEIGEVLPHWEAALYLLRPEELSASASAVRRNLYLLIACALVAIATGIWVVFADTRRQLALAEKKTDFVSNVSHELKTPLTSIRMFAEMMHSGRAKSHRQPEYLRIIMVEAERLTRLINNVLDFARLERKHRRFEMRVLDLHAVLTEVWSVQEAHFRERGLQVSWEAAPPPYLISGDRDALAQAVTNLLSNAEKYGGEAGELSLHSYLEQRWVCVSVLDRGPGVPEGEESKIFQPFYRAHDSLSSGVPGTGLGLSLVSRIVAEHDGETLYQERPQGGANFTIRLPRYFPPDPEA